MEEKRSINVVQQKIIASLLRGNYELLSLAHAKLYTAGKDIKEWLFSELEGGLTLVVDYNRKSARFILFDLRTYEILFEAELYKNLNTFYTRGNDLFQYFEVANGFIGFKFADKAAASLFLDSVSALDKKKIEKILSNQKPVPQQDLKTKSKRILNLLMLKLSEEYLFKKSDVVDYTVDFNIPQIERQLNLLNYDSRTASFNINGNSDEIDELVDKVRSIKQNRNFDKDDVELFAKELVKNVITSQKFFVRKKTLRLKPEEIKKIQEEKKKEDKRLAELKKAEEKKLAEQKKLEEKRLAEQKKADEKRLEQEKKEAEKKRLAEEKEKKKNPGKQAPSSVPSVPSVPAVPKVPAVPSAPAVPKVPAVPSVPAVPKVPAVPSIPTVPSVPTVPSIPGVPNIPPLNTKPPQITTTTEGGEGQPVVTTEGGEVQQTEPKKEEVKEPPKKREPKVDMMSELKRKMQERENKKKGIEPTPTPQQTNTGANNQDKPKSKLQELIAMQNKKNGVEEVKVEPKTETKDPKPSDNQPQNTVPSIPTIPSTPSVPTVPTVPSIPVVPSIPSIPSIPTAPTVPGIPGVPSIPSIPGVPSIPSAPGVPSIPSIPTIPIATVPKVTAPPQEVSKLDEMTTMADTNPGLLSQIAAGGFKLKKVVTVEKTGIEYLKKKNSVKGQAPTEQKQASSGGGGQKTGDFMGEMRRKMEAMMKK